MLNNPVIMTYLSYIVTFGSAIFVLPLVLLKLNSIEISIWFLFATILGLAALADSGFGATLVRAVSYFYCGKKSIPKNINEFKKKVETTDKNLNIDGISRLMQTSNILYLGISIFSTIIVLVVGYFVIYNLITMATNQDSLWLAFYLLTVTVFVRMQTVKWNSFLHGFDKVAVQKQIETVIGVIKIFAYIAILSFGMNILELVIADLILALFTFFITSYKMKQLFQKNLVLKVNTFKYDKEIMQSIFPSAWRFGLIGWGSYFINYGSSLIVSQLADPKIIASFLVTQRIIFFARQLAQVPIYAQLPRIFQMMSLHQFSKLKLFISKSIFIGFSILIVLLVGIGILGNVVLDFIDVETKLVTTDIFLIMAISIILEYHHSVHSQIYMGSNHVPFLFPALFSGVLIIIIGIGVVGTYGLNGIVLTQFFVQLSINNWYPVYLNLKLLDWKFVDYLKNVIMIPSTYFKRNIH